MSQTQNKLNLARQEQNENGSRNHSQKGVTSEGVTQKKSMTLRELNYWIWGLASGWHRWNLGGNLV